MLSKTTENPMVAGRRIFTIKNGQQYHFCFRNTDTPKRIFWSKDHQTDEEIIEEVYPAIRHANTSLNTVAVRNKLIRDYRKAKLELIAESPNLQGYELVQDDQMPTDNMSLATWLVRNQTKVMTSERMVFMDFKAPLEFEAVLVPKSAM